LPFSSVKDASSDNRYYNSKILKRVEEIAGGKQIPSRTEPIPGAQYIYEAA
jgi:hypothetical protein